MSKPSQRPVLLAVTSDHHCNSTLGLCPAEGVRLDDGGTYRPSKAQLWLWENWLDYWAKVDQLRKQHKARFYAVINGDPYDGDHHNTAQIVSRNPETMMYIGEQVFDQVRDRKPEKAFVVRGTEAHSGISGNMEESLARWFHAERDPQLQTWSWWHLQLDIYGVLFDFQHHGAMGQLPWTRANVTNRIAVETFYDACAHGFRPPNVVVRSHQHRYADSGRNHPTQVVFTPAWQLKTAFIYKIAPNAIADIGGLIFLVQPNGSYTYEVIRYTPEPPQAVWVR